MQEIIERFRIERHGSGLRISLDQRKNALVNVAFGVVLITAGYLWPAPLGSIIMWVGVGWTLLAAKAYSSRRFTEIGEVLTHRNERKERSMARSEVSRVVLRLRRRPRRSQKKGVLPWEVEIWGPEPRPFATYRFQYEDSARSFADRITGTLGTALETEVYPTAAVDG